jgi:hypothetical protein
MFSRNYRSILYRQRKCNILVPFCYDGMKLHFFKDFSQNVSFGSSQHCINCTRSCRRPTGSRKYCSLHSKYNYCIKDLCSITFCLSKSAIDVLIPCTLTSIRPLTRTLVATDRRTDRQTDRERERENVQQVLFTISFLS